MGMYVQLHDTLLYMSQNFLYLSSYFLSSICVQQFVVLFQYTIYKYI